MPTYKDILTGDTMMSGSHKIETVWGLVYEVEGAWADDSAHKSFLDIDLVKEGNLMHEPMDEWTFESRIYMYRDAVLEAMSKKGASAEKMKSFYLGFNGYVAGILPRFDQFQIFVASRSPDGLIIPISYRPGGKPPYMVLWKQGLEKVE